MYISQVLPYISFPNNPFYGKYFVVPHSLDLTFISPYLKMY